MEDEKDNVEVLSDVLKDLKINGKNNQVQTLEKTSAFLQHNLTHVRQHFCHTYIVGSRGASQLGGIF